MRAPSLVAAAVVAAVCVAAAPPTRANPVVGPIDRRDEAPPPQASRWHDTTGALVALGGAAVLATVWIVRRARAPGTK